MLAGLPEVWLLMAMTADGRTSSASREYPRFTQPEDRVRMQRLRAQTDAVLVGAETIRALNPPLAVKDPALQAQRQQAGRTASPLQVVLSASGRVDPACRALNDPLASQRILATTTAGARNHRGAHRYDVWSFDGERIQPHALLLRLAQQGVRHVLLEGGAQTNGAFLDVGLVTGLYLTVAPTLLGGEHAPGLIGGNGLTIATRQSLSLTELSRVGDELYLTYHVVHEHHAT